MGNNIMKELKYWDQFSQNKLKTSKLYVFDFKIDLLLFYNTNYKSLTDALSTSMKISSSARSSLYTFQEKLHWKTGREPSGWVESCWGEGTWIWIIVSPATFQLSWELLGCISIRHHANLHIYCCWRKCSDVTRLCWINLQKDVKIIFSVQLHPSQLTRHHCVAWAVSMTVLMTLGIPLNRLPLLLMVAFKI